MSWPKWAGKLFLGPYYRVQAVTSSRPLHSRCYLGRIRKKQPSLVPELERFSSCTKNIVLSRNSSNFPSQKKENEKFVVGFGQVSDSGRGADGSWNSFFFKFLAAAGLMVCLYEIKV